MLQLGFATLMQRQAAPFPPASPKEGAKMRKERGRTKEDNAEFETMVHQRRVSGATDKINAIGDAHPTTDDDK